MTFADDWKKRGGSSNFGGMQQSQEDKERELPEHPEQSKAHGAGRYGCPYIDCIERFQSDEAVQLHRIWHELFILRLSYQGAAAYPSDAIRGREGEK